MKTKKDVWILESSGLGFVKLGVLGEILSVCGKALQDEVLRTILVKYE